MNVAYAPVFVDELFARRDLVGLHTLISVRSRTRKMSDACELYCRLLEWTGATRSGIWQYYESLKEEEFLEVSRLLGKFEMAEVLARYRVGRDVWQDEEASAALDRWIDAQQHDIHTAILAHLRTVTEELKKNEGDLRGFCFAVARNGTPVEQARLDYLTTHRNLVARRLLISNLYSV